MTCANILFADDVIPCISAHFYNTALYPYQARNHDKGEAGLGFGEDAGEERAGAVGEADGVAVGVFVVCLDSPLPEDAVPDGVADGEKGC